MKIISFTGMRGGAAADAADIRVFASSAETSHVQEVLLIAGHAICDAVEKTVTSAREAAIE